MDANEIRAIRKQLGLTGDALAAKLGVSGNTVRRWEMGLRHPSGAAKVLLRRLVDDGRAAAKA